MFNLTVPINAADHVIGPSDASVTVVEYGDFECPNCKQAAPAVKQLLRHFEGRMRFSYRHFPLEEVHPHALHAAETAESAGGQGKFWPMHDVLFDNQQHLKITQLRSYAERLQLDMDRYTAEMDDRIFVQRIHAHIESAAVCQPLAVSPPNRLLSRSWQARTGGQAHSRHKGTNRCHS